MRICTVEKIDIILGMEDEINQWVYECVNMYVYNTRTHTNIYIYIYILLQKLQITRVRVL